jgi:hypothetical protein
VSPYISVSLQKAVRQHFHYCCAYCHTAESLIATTFEIEHIVPKSAGGYTILENLCLSCPHCNRHKSARQTFQDPETLETVSLFHPNQQSWQDHFAWNEDASILVGLTPIGRATIAALEMNRSVLVRLRKIWFKIGEHPPIIN